MRADRNSGEERNTVQKEAVLNYLRGVKTYPTAQKVYKAVKKRLPHISLGTVYRNLEILVKKGEVLKITTSGQMARYSGDVSPHGHFICEKCEQIYDVFDRFGSLKRLRLKAGKTKHIHVYFLGLCKRCLPASSTGSSKRRKKTIKNHRR